MKRMLRMVAIGALVAVEVGVAQDMDPVGNYEFEVASETQTLSGLIEITGDPGAWHAVLSAPDIGLPPLPASSVVVRGKRLTVTIPFLDDLDAVVVDVVFEGDDFTGTWKFGEDSGDVTGRRIEG